MNLSKYAIWFVVAFILTACGGGGGSPGTSSGGDAVAVDAKPIALFTTAPTSVTVAIGATPGYSVGGGTGPYTATSDNTTIATVSLTDSSMTITGKAVGSAKIVVRDSVGSTVSVNVTVGTVVLAITPSNATGIIDDVLIATITGGTPPYRASVGNVLVASAVVQNSNELKITLLQVGQTIVTVLDANNQSTAYSLTSNAATPGIRLSPNALTVSEFGSEPVFLTVYGAAAGAMNVFSSDVTRLTATISGQTVTVTTGSNGNRCVTSDTPVTISVVDATRATGVAVVTIEDNAEICP